ncbi:hypothetical protein POM88_014312 [Heracleum sosnowskyi]|uniref:Non-specific serine/threonine protein kinase n=1 Tax=Heracleum sosnowskyi TaxID=360622 RepID=A0AAD8J0V5_9APIA|nr:hypothetical protein POM88_014312 [Heracleum sosnowskyi]
MLRSYNISGKIPNYLSQLATLKILDLSFNKLEGEIPTHLHNLTSLKILYLTNNSLTGNIPDWITFTKFIDNKDLSYNNFSSDQSEKCTELLNMFRSYENNLTFESDEDSGGQARFVFWRRYWGTSSTGFFNDLYTARNISVLKMNDSVLYTRARLSPLSLSPNRERNITIVVVVVALGFLLLTFPGIVWWKGYLGNRISREEGDVV